MTWSGVTLVVVAAPSASDDDLRTAAGIASLALTLLTFFTNMRREALKAYRADAKPLGWKVLRNAAPDLLLAALTGGAALALMPLLLDTFEVDQLVTRGGTVVSLFALICLGFWAVFAFQVWTVFQWVRTSRDARPPNNG